MLVPVYNYAFLGDVVPVLTYHKESLDVIASPEMDLDIHITTYVLDTFTEILSIGNHHMDVAMVGGVFGAGIIPEDWNGPVHCCV